MTEPINIRLLGPGTRIVLDDGAVAEIVSNPLDGVWVFARLLSSPDDARQGRERGDDLRTRHCRNPDFGKLTLQRKGRDGGAVAAERSEAIHQSDDTVAHVGHIEIQ